MNSTDLLKVMNQKLLKKMSDKVNHPSHYTWLKEKCGIEVIDITRHMDFDLGNAIKYISRAGKKDKSKEAEDIKKAIWYLNRYLKKESAE